MADKTHEDFMREHAKSMQQARDTLRRVNRLLLPYQRAAWLEGMEKHYQSGGLTPLPEVPDAWKPEKLTETERAAAERERERRIDALLEAATRDRTAQ